MKLRSSFPQKLPPIVDRYLQGDASLKAFYAHKPSISGMLDYASRRTFDDERRSVLVEVLQEQAQASSYATEHTLQNIKALGDQDVYTVTTGHQLCIYGGPMFFLYKIISAISVAHKMNAKGVRVVPVYWMASEDHDFEEIDHIRLNDQTFRWQNDQEGAVGPMGLTAIRKFQLELEHYFQDDPLRLATLTELKRIYDPSKSLGEATRDLVHWIFGKYGVVVIDAADARLKGLFSGVVKQELESEVSFSAVNETSEQLDELGYPSQVTPREINLFWMEEESRERIVKSGTGFITVDETRNWSEEELIETLRLHPEKFSPNVVLRPVYQECILPNLGYIGGPGELSYWFQLKRLFDKVEVPFPVLLMRDQAVLLTDKASKRLHQLGLEETDLYTDAEALFSRLVRDAGTHEHLVDEAMKTMEGALDDLVKQMNDLDASLGESSRAERQRILNRIEALKKKVFRSDKRRQETMQRRVDELIASSYPNNIPQERVYHWLMYAHMESLDEFVDVLAQSFDPFTRGVKVFGV